jgi:hypothetical protein
MFKVYENKILHFKINGSENDFVNNLYDRRLPMFNN